MATIETALGPIPDSQLGFTLSHEHVLSGAARGFDLKAYPWMFDWEAARRVAIQSLLEAKAAGIDSFIDLTTPVQGRDTAFMVDVARATGFNIVCGTGLYLQIPTSFALREIDESADIFVREIEVGIDDTGVKAGAIKVATDENRLTPDHDRVLRAAARASNRTGCPISTHHWAAGEQGREQVRIFQEEGMQMDRVCIGHTADSTSLEYIEWLLNQGVYISMDRYREAPGRVSWQNRNALVKALVERGWASKMMLGHDGHASFPFRKDQEPEGGFKPDDSLLFVSRTAIPALIADGVSQDSIDLMMRESPRRFLTGEE